MAAAGRVAAGVGVAVGRGGGYDRAMERRILHVDMDEFFAAVEKLDDPALRGKPLLVGGDPSGRGVVSTASYEARAFGCRSAMPMARAVRLCPGAIVLPVRMRRYAAVSEQIFEVFDSFTPLVEPLSIDEAFLDVTGCRRLLGEPEVIGRAVKAAIRERVGVTASVGAASNKFLAKLASDLDKPDGLTMITDENLRATLDPLAVRKLWGVGAVAAAKLERLNIVTIGQLHRAGAELLTQALGSAGEHLWRLARGLDDRSVTPDSRAKSIGQEQTFATDIDDMEQLRRILSDQVDQVARRVRRGRWKAKTVTLKLRYADFTTLTRSDSQGATDVTAEMHQRAKALLETWARSSRRPLRLLGFTATGLVRRGGGEQLELFCDPQRVRNERLDRTLDAIVDRFGSGAVRRASGREPRREGGA